MENVPLSELNPAPSPRIDFDGPGEEHPTSYIILSSVGRPNGASFFRPSRLGARQGTVTGATRSGDDRPGSGAMLMSFLYTSQ